MFEDAIVSCYNVPMIRGVVTDSKIKEISDKIAKGFAPERIILFGSQAWGQTTEDSDVDLFIIKDTNERRVDRAREVRKIIWGMGVPVDILVYTPEEVKKRLLLEDFFIQDIVTKGKVLYDQAGV